MPKYSYIALDRSGNETKGSIEAGSQNEAIGRVKEMQLFPTKIVEAEKEKPADKKAAKKGKAPVRPGAKKKGMNLNLSIPGMGGKVKPKILMTFTRQLATLVDAGLPLLRGLRVLEKQERNATLKRIVGELATAIEGGSTFSEALAQHPKTFNKLFVNMVKAGELGGVLEVVLKRLAEFSEKAQKIKGKVKAALFYPIAVMIVACGIMVLLMCFVVPKFKDVFAGMGVQMPGFTLFVMWVSDTIKNNILGTMGALAVVVVLFLLFIKTKFGRRLWDKFKLIAPAIGPVISKVAISRFARTLGTLVSSGVPILQALTIVKETAGNVIISTAVVKIHESVKEGETITAPMEGSGVFPPMVVSMVDVGEQTGALPEMLLRIADDYDEQVDNAVAAMTSLLEPIMIIFLAVIVGSIVIAMFLPLIAMISSLSGEGDGKKGE
ncbi:MAG TPA: type II secretion system F family protein [Candidatus Sulfotelmatobacter sp.]|jgi:type IV pilus assembly protein PilC|nr:type II secretion system F family protein [Candidatus Sulfotelmatobacter sp.]